MTNDPTTEPLTFRSDLDNAKCSVEGCTECDDELELSAPCHPRKPLWVTYHKGGELELTCAVCDEAVARIAVAG